MGLVHEVWTTQDGLPVNSINALLQSRDGYIWAATFDGLVGIARAMPPDLIVVDVDGEPAGSAVDRMLGGQPELVNVPVLVITDEASGSDRTIGSGTARGRF